MFSYTLCFLSRLISLKHAACTVLLPVTYTDLHRSIVGSLLKVILMPVLHELLNKGRQNSMCSTVDYSSLNQITGLSTIYLQYGLLLVE